MSPVLSQNNISTNAESDKIRNYALFGNFLGVGQISELQWGGSNSHVTVFNPYWCWWEEYCIAQVIASPSHVYTKHGLTCPTCLRHTVTKCHMWPVTPCNATPTGHHRHGPGPTERCCPPGSGSHTTCVGGCTEMTPWWLPLFRSMTIWMHGRGNKSNMYNVYIWNKNSWHLPSYLTCCWFYMLGCTLWRYLCRVPSTECYVVIAGGHTTGHCVTTCLVIFHHNKYLAIIWEE